jgi:hypothetical protein
VRAPDRFHRVDAGTRDAEKPGTLGREKAEEKYQDASANYREIASQIAMRGPDRA